MRPILAALLGLALLPAPAMAETLHVVGAGSLSAAISDLLRRFPAGADTVAPPVFGPSGLMREQIEAGAPADLFASADMDHARRLAVGHPERMVINFTRNQLCATARPAIGLTADNVLDRLLDPKVRIATSTPGADPGGDYAWAVFARAEAVRPGARAMLEGKAQALVGGGDKTPLLVPGKGAVAGVFLADRADVMLGYCSSAAALEKEVPGLVNVPLPPALAVTPAYGMVLLNDKPVTLRFAAFIMSEPAQAVMKRYGFAPTALAGQAPAAPDLLVQRAGKPARLLDPSRLASITQRVKLASEHGEAENVWSGPLLWTVLTEAGAIDAARPAEQVRLTVRVTGADGYTVTLAAAELSPEFAGRPVQLADLRDGAKLDTPRLVVPGEKRAGRSVRDVVRIDVE